MGVPNWGKLYAQGRCKAIGVAWSNEEVTAVYQLGIPAEYVRSGILTEEEYEKARNKDEKNGRPLERLGVNELRDKARELKVDFTPQTPDLVLIDLIGKASKPKKSDKKAESKK